MLIIISAWFLNLSKKSAHDRIKRTWLSENGIWLWTDFESDWRDCQYTHKRVFRFVSSSIAATVSPVTASPAGPAAARPGRRTAAAAAVTTVTPAAVLPLRAVPSALGSPSSGSFNRSRTWSVLVFSLVKINHRFMNSDFWSKIHKKWRHEHSSNAASWLCKITSKMMS